MTLPKLPWTWTNLNGDDPVMKQHNMGFGGEALLSADGMLIASTYGWQDTFSGMEKEVEEFINYLFHSEECKQVMERFMLENCK